MGDATLLVQGVVVILGMIKQYLHDLGTNVSDSRW